MLPNGNVLIVGGVFAELYDPDTGTFRLTGTQITESGSGVIWTLPPVWRDPSGATLLLNGMVLFNGGNADSGPAYDAWVYNPSTGTFTATGSMATPRAYHTATLLPDGAVLTAAGSWMPASAEIYNPVLGAFSATADVLTTRARHTATLLNNGRVLIAGGEGSKSAELYDPPC